jgi:hypothetical protein
LILFLRKSSGAVGLRRQPTPTMNSIEQVKAAVENGSTIHWKSTSYTVRKGSDGDFCIHCANGHVAFLGKGYKAEDFFAA